MPNKQSAIKALRQGEKRRVLNVRRKREMRALLKQGLAFAEQGKKKEAEALIPQLFKAVDKAAKRGILKKNTAARRKSMYVRAIARGATTTKKAAAKASKKVIGKKSGKSVQGRSASGGKTKKAAASKKPSKSAAKK